MRVIFMGTPEFAVPALAALAREHEIVAVLTRPDMPAGRGKALTPPPVAVASRELCLPIHQPTTLRDADVVERLRELAPDVICVVAYGVLLPPDVLGLPRFGCVNVHASLLPRHRGAAPIERAILEGDAQTGVAIMRMEEGLDTGPVASQVVVPVEDRTAGELRLVLAEAGATALLDVLRRLPDGVSWEEQDSSRATYAAKVTSADLALDPALPAAMLGRRVRAAGESAVSRACIAGRLVTVESACVLPEGPRAGAVDVRADGIVLGTSEGGLLVKHLTPAGKRSMDAAAFARGARLDSTSGWEAPPCR